MSNHGRVLRAVGVLSLAVVLVAACGSSRRDFEASTAEVLVPTDERFLGQWFFGLDDGPDNYTARSHWDPSFNPHIDRALATESYQVNDLDSWTGQVPGETDAGAQAFVDAIADARADREPCKRVSADPVVHQCEYDEGRVEPLRMFVRAFGDTTMLVFGDSPAAREYVTGEFQAMSTLEAAPWFQE